MLFEGPAPSYLTKPSFFRELRFPGNPGFLLGTSAYIQKKFPQESGGNAFFGRYRADSNRCTSFCRALPNLSATVPCF